MLLQRNERLSETKEFNFSKAYDEFRQYKENTKSQKVCDKDEVIAEMKSLWVLRQKQDEEIAIMKKEIRKGKIFV